MTQIFISRYTKLWFIETTEHYLAIYIMIYNDRERSSRPINEELSQNLECELSISNIYICMFSEYTYTII